MNKFKNKWSLSIKNGDEYIKNGYANEWNDGNLSISLDYESLKQLIKEVENDNIKLYNNKYLTLKGKNFEIKTKLDNEIPF